MPCTTDVAPVGPVAPPPAIEYDADIPDKTKDAVAATDPVCAKDEVNVLNGKNFNIVL
jgi:hypothetical protein